jgi:Domain of unknown function (DUF4167)
MRPNQQNKNRSRGRNNNNNNGRKQFNPLSRNYESNGPDVKIRGNAAHIAEKYVQLARDAQSTGDSVMAENYLQHAEHYFRILSAAQGQMPQRQDQFNDSDDDAEDSQDGAAADATPEPAQAQASGEDGDAQAETETSGAGEASEGRRGRRPRRRRNAEGDEGDNGGGRKDPAAAPQPEVGELPAFLTGNTPASAAE